MSRSRVIVSLCIVVLMAATLFSGCATTSQLEEVRATAEQALRTAEEAQAGVAGMTGQQPEDRSADYQRMSQEAKDAADRAEAAAEKSERIFDKISGK
jgi:type II secretory pathway pseudopilin PulG